MKKDKGHDNIPSFFLHSAVETIAPYLQCFINFSFTHGTLPDNLAHSQNLSNFIKKEANLILTIIDPSQLLRASQKYWNI